MKIKIKDSDGPLTDKEQQVAALATKLMTSEEHRRYREERVVYWDTDTQRLAGKK